MTELTRVGNTRLVLGESPLWDGVAGVLRAVDLIEGQLLTIDIASGRVEFAAIESPLGAVVQRRSGGFVLAVGRQLEVLEGDERRHLVTVELEANLRLNDAACDPVGRLFVGSTGGLAAPGRGSLYRVDPDGAITSVVRGTTLSNGIGWSPEGTSLYFADSGHRAVYSYEYAVETGSLGRGSIFIAFNEGEGAPDGIAVDVDGGIWVASFGGGFVRRYTPAGEPTCTLRLPCAQVTNCAFGGTYTDQLFITTARFGLSPAELAAQPTAGSIFRASAGIQGLAAQEFAG